VSPALLLIIYDKIILNTPQKGINFITLETLIFGDIRKKLRGKEEERK
jgi:hypothetical protein